jgi:hypothetical protein
MKLTGGLLFCFLIFLTYSAAKSSDIQDSKLRNSSPPEKVGTLTVKINGTQYSGDLFSETKPYAYQVSTGNKDYEVRLEWKYVSSPSEIKTGSADLSSGSDMNAGYINFRVPYNYITRSGYVTVEENDGSEPGSSALAVEKNNYPGGKTSGSANVRTFSDGTFEINYGK